MTNGQSKTFCNQLPNTYAGIRDDSLQKSAQFVHLRGERERDLVTHVHRSAGRSTTRVQVEWLSLLESIEDDVQVSKQW